MICQALAASSALGLRSALSLAVPRLLRVRARAAALLKVGAMVVEGPEEGDGEETVSDVDVAATEDAQAARLAALAGLVGAVDDKVRS